MNTECTIPGSIGRGTRREVLLGAIALVAGAASLPSWAYDDLNALTLHGAGRAYFDPLPMRVLSRVVDILIPRTDTPGALDAAVDVFIDRLMAEWASEETRKHYVAVLREIDNLAKDRYSLALADCDEAEQRELVRDIDADAFHPGSRLPGFRDLKELVLAGYYTSKAGATVELRYERVPARYVECLAFDELGRAWSHR
jgi:hypothetical protein